MNDILQKIQEIGIVPVIALDDAKDAEPLGAALSKGGLLCAEITFRTAAAEESIKIISKKFPHLLVGAGTVLTIEQVDKAVAAGAQFVVSPGFNPRIVAYCVKNNILMIPGCSSPSDIELALEQGINVVKFFPAEQSGGLEYIKAIAAPYVGVKFMATGGINPQNVKDYLAYNRIAACGGSWMVKSDLINHGKFDEIATLSKEAVEIVKNSRA
ncbi:MAG: bifunctional 4-hydroxy-2-oxoglutarate aldolase/2-dehydro-3-deoxy-phosphogluconate aldolase [Lachnospiraceae bacterium]|nr:bifunctional 4-hydroxy-2-oxoglutarate aldolase/2-dehydro-3-deoxy-phosphogluconate aldolase [Lachnospiraceae bacterium]